MSKTLGETINNIMEDNSSNRVLILTNHLHIVGTIHNFDGKCSNCNDCLIALKDVKIARIEDMCSYQSESCECDLGIFVEYKWFNISVNAIVGFSILSDEY